LQIPRRLLPSVSLLSAFEAAARTGSISAAARELSLTQSAVSRQIKALEEQLGANLFIRERQSIRLTLAGISYARDIKDALRRISMASLNFRANPKGGTLNLAAPPTFASRWLAPRLAEFAAANPDIMLNLSSLEGEPDFRVEPHDAAIYFGDIDALGLDGEHLCAETVLPVCSAGVKSAYGFKEAADIRKARLLILVSRPDAWERWLASQDAPAEDVHGMMFDQFSQIIEAAAGGLGVALVPTLLISRELERGSLVPALPLPTRSEGHYALVWPPDRAHYPPLDAFRSWLQASLAVLP
jgi:LysR family transcriptional regulator, glycine cleavage system transcriptional activator